MTTETTSKGYFDVVYRDYERQNPAKKLDHYIDALISFSPSKETRLLDIGCGLGAFLWRAHQRRPDWKLVGTDIDEEGVSARRVRVPSARVVRAAASSQPFPCQSFNVVTAWDVLEHVQDLEAARTTIRNLLTPGGVVAFVVPVYDGPVGPLVRLLDKDPTHVHKRSRRFWLEWAAEEFEVTAWHGIFRYLVGRHHIHWTTHRLRTLSPAILVFCRNHPDSQ
ncbi:MAG: class I SAM-dependent methyltransferase [Gammaproteobacteria bacterium]